MLNDTGMSSRSDPYSFHGIEPRGSGPMNEQKPAVGKIRIITMDPLDFSPVMTVTIDDGVTDTGGTEDVCPICRSIAASSLRRC
jgi:hypothetical protein